MSAQKLHLFPVHEIVIATLNAGNKELALCEKLQQYAGILKEHDFPDIVDIIKEYMPGESKWIARAMLRSGTQAPEAAYYMIRALCFDVELLNIALDVYSKSARFRNQLQREDNPRFAKRIAESLRSRGLHP